MIIEPTISLNTEKEKVENKSDEKLQAKVTALEEKNKELEKELEKALKELAALKTEQAESAVTTPKIRRTSREV